MAPLRGANDHLPLSGGLRSASLLEYLEQNYEVKVLRFDLRVVPPMVAVYLSMNVLADALEKQTPSARALAAISIASLLALAWAATNYLLRPMKVVRSATVEPKPAE